MKTSNEAKTDNLKVGFLILEYRHFSLVIDAGLGVSIFL